MSDDIQVIEPKTKTLRNGAVYSYETHKIIKGAPMDAAKASALATARQQLKRQVVAQAANAAVERQQWRTDYGDNAWIAAIADNAMVKATTPDDPKAIDAARFLLQEAGLAEQRQAPLVQAESITLNVLVADAMRDALALYRAGQAEQDEE